MIVLSLVLSDHCSPWVLDLAPCIREQGIGISLNNKRPWTPPEPPKQVNLNNSTDLLTKLLIRCFFPLWAVVSLLQGSSWKWSVRRENHGDRGAERRSGWRNEQQSEVRVFSCIRIHLVIFSIDGFKVMPLSETNKAAQFKDLLQDLSRWLLII